MELEKQDLRQKFNSSLIQHCAECGKEDAVDTTTGLCEECFNSECELEKGIPTINRLVRTTLNLEQWQCQKCGFFWYANDLPQIEKSVDWGCPQGCDDAGEHVRTFKAEIQHVEEHFKENGD